MFWGAGVELDPLSEDVEYIAIMNNKDGTEEVERRLQWRGELRRR